MKWKLLLDEDYNIRLNILSYINYNEYKDINEEYFWKIKFKYDYGKYIIANSNNYRSLYKKYYKYSLFSSNFDKENYIQHDYIKLFTKYFSKDKRELKHLRLYLLEEHVYFDRETLLYLNYQMKSNKLKFLTDDFDDMLNEFILDIFNKKNLDLGKDVYNKKTLYWCNGKLITKNYNNMYNDITHYTDIMFPGLDDYYDDLQRNIIIQYLSLSYEDYLDLKFNEEHKNSSYHYIVVDHIIGKFEEAKRDKTIISKAEKILKDIDKIYSKYDSEE